MPTWTLIVLIMGEPAVVTPGYATEAACRAAQAQVKPKHLELMGGYNVGDIMGSRCFPAPK
jgi:hypothetical protein